MRRFVRLVLLVPLLAAISLPGQSASSSQPAGCGDPAVRFSVHRSRTATASAAPAGSALVVFLTDDAEFNYVPGPVTRAALDGAWTGATRGTGSFSFVVATGAHRLCASWQAFNSGGALSGLKVGYEQRAASTEFTAEAGRTYYFLVRNSYSAAAGAALELKQLEPAAGAAQQRRAQPTRSAAQAVVGESYLGGLVKKR